MEYSGVTKDINCFLSINNIIPLLLATKNSERKITEYATWPTTKMYQWASAGSQHHLLILSYSPKMYQQWMWVFEHSLCANQHGRHWGLRHTFIQQIFIKHFLVAQKVKNLPAMQETQVQSMVRKIPWRRQRLLTPVFLPGQRSLEG